MRTTFPELRFVSLWKYVASVVDCIFIHKLLKFGTRYYEDCQPAREFGYQAIPPLPTPTFPTLHGVKFANETDRNLVAVVPHDDIPQAIAQAVTSYAEDADFKDGVFVLEALDVAVEQTVHRVSLEHIV